MKLKTTRKAIVNDTPAACLVSAGYCSLPYLLRNHAPIAYTCGVYGWNFDVYHVYGLTICTGYRGMPGRTAESVHAYNDAAEAILSDYTSGKSWEERDQAVENLLKEFCELNLKKGMED